MKQKIQFQQTGFVLFSLVVAQLGVPQTLQQVAIASDMATKAAIAPPQVPNNLRVPTGQVLLLKGSAKGVQIYECKAQIDNANQFEWKLKAPEANLFNDQGKKISTHYAGPTWEALDGSKVIGQLKASVKSPETNAIPWLLLQAKSNEGNGTFSKVKYIQRVNTVGGKAPAQGCDKAHPKAQVRVNYTADYFFYGAAP